MSDPIVVALINRLSRKYGDDPRAVRAVASVEGGLRRGAIGDAGTSGGPFQEHIGGALPHGRTLAWASTDAGIEHAIRGLSRYARGKKGRAAIAAIVQGFERPADIPGEIAKASARYGIGGGGGINTSLSSGAGASGRNPGLDAAPPGLSPLLGAVFNANNEILGLPPLPLDLSAGPPSPLVVRSKRTRFTVASTAPRTGRAENLARRPKSGRTIRFLEHFAAPYGLTVTSTTGGKHVKGSYHYRGRAVDFGGDPHRMAALARNALRHPQDFAELFYTGPGNPGVFIKDGRVYPNSQLDRGLYDEHTNHVHLAA